MPEPVAWWLILEVMGAIAFPIAFVLFSSLPDRGYAFAKVLGLLLVGYGLWMGGFAVSLPNSRESIFGLMALVLAASLALAFFRRREIGRWLADNWRYVIAAEVVFVLAFAFFALLRAYFHDINYGEKPQNLAFLNAVLRDDTLPAYDPWYSGHDLSYYYLGHLTVSILARLAHTPASVAFNLGSATIGALAAIAVFGIGYNFVASGGRFARGLAVGVTAVLLLLVVSNLEGLFELLAAHGVGNKAFYEWWEIHGLDGPCSTNRWYPTEFWWWSRAAFVSDTYGGKEFPFTSFLFGDIHAHTAALPFALTSVGLALNVARSPDGLDWRSWRSRPGLLLLAALVLGSLAFVNAVDLPTYATLVALAAFVAAYAGRARSALAAAGRALGYVAPLGIVAVLLYLPFYLNFHPIGDGIQPLEAATRPGWIPLKAVVLRPTHFLVLWGPTVWLACTLAVAALAVLGRRAVSRAAVGWACLAWGIPVGLWAMMLAVHRAPWGLAEEIATRGYAWITAAFLAALVAALALALGRHLCDARDAEGPDRSLLFALAATGLGALLLLGMEFYWIQDPQWGRQNTTLRLGYQAWLLLSVGGAFALYYVVSRLRPASLASALRGAGWAAGSIVVLGAALIFPAAATFYISNDFQNARELDGLAFERRGNPGEYAAVRWLQDNVKGAPVVLEGVGDDYNPTAARVSTRTGLPTILGWPTHEFRLQDTWEPLNERRKDVETAYNTTSLAEAKAILDKYSVEYVYVGDFEQQTYDEAGLHKFVGLGRIVFRQGEVTIYEVLREDEAASER
jgi:YYY domain-containing protein